MLRPAPQYRCDNLARAGRLSADATFEGIDQVEVLTDDALAPRDGVTTDVELRQRVLLFHLPQAVDTGGTNILEQGGVVITDLPFVWADSAANLITPDVSAVPAGEQDQVTDQLLPDPGHRR